MKKANPAKQKKMIIVFVILMVIIMVTAMSNKDDEQAPAKEDQYTPASFEEIYQAYEDNGHNQRDGNRWAYEHDRRGYPDDGKEDWEYNRCISCRI